MKRSELRKMIKEELLKEYDTNTTKEILDAVDAMYVIFKKLKNDKIIPKELTKNLYNDFKPLYISLNKITTFIHKKNAEWN